MRSSVVGSFVALAIAMVRWPSPIPAQSSQVRPPQPISGNSGNGVNGVPAALIITSREALPDALRFADKSADGGLVVLVCQPPEDATTEYVTQSMRLALDSLRRRADVGADRVGVIAVGEETSVIPTLVTDTTLAFLVAVHTTPHTTTAVTNSYQEARVPTLVLRAPTVALDTMAAVTSQAVTKENDRRETNGYTTVSLVRTIGDHVTIWPVPATTLARLSVPLEPTVDRVVRWVQQQVGVTRAAEVHQLDAVVVH